MFSLQPHVGCKKLQPLRLGPWGPPHELGIVVGSTARKRLKATELDKERDSNDTPRQCYLRMFPLLATNRIENYVINQFYSNYAPQLYVMITVTLLLLFIKSEQLYCQKTHIFTGYMKKEKKQKELTTS